MIRIGRIVCPVDTSPFSARALRHASALASWYRAELTALAVLPPPVEALLASELPGAWPLDLRGLVELNEQELRSFVSKATGAPGTRIVTTRGPVVQEILRIATALTADLLVLGTHGHGGFDQLLLGSVTERVLRRAPCPVMTVPSLANGDPADVVEVKTIVCGIDFSDASARALDYARSVARRAGSRLVLLHALEWFAEAPQKLTGHFNVPEFRQALEHDARARLEALAQRDAGSPVETDIVVGYGKAYVELLRVAAEREADLVVLGVRGAGAVDLLLFGSTTEHVVRRARCPVLTVR
jgi:nucleotide-binding universal stress UspA family protein